MDGPDVSNGTGSNPLKNDAKQASSANILTQPIDTTAAGLLQKHDALKRFLSLTGGSIFYCLSALSILYGIAQSWVKFCHLS